MAYEVEGLGIAAYTIIGQMLKHMANDGVIQRQTVDRILSESTKLNLETPRGQNPANKQAAFLIEELRSSLLGQ